MKALLLVIAVAGSAPALAGAACNEIYVSNELSGDLSVIDARTNSVAATISVGKRPRGLKVSRDGRVLYVALSGSPGAGPGVDESKLPPADKSADGIGVVDLASHQLLRVLRGVSDPEQLAVSADGRQLFVASEDEGSLVVLDAKDGDVRARIPVGAEAEGVNLSPDGTVVYVTSEAEHRVTVVDAHTLKVLAQVETGLRPRSTAFSADGRRAYVMNEAGGSVTVLDTRTHAAIRTFKIAEQNVLPMSGAVSADGATLYITTGRGGRVLALNTTDGTTRGSVATGTRPWGLAMKPDGSRLYTANGPSGDVTVIDSRALKSIATVSVGKKPWGVACRAE